MLPATTTPPSAPTATAALAFLGAAAAAVAALRRCHSSSSSSSSSGAPPPSPSPQSPPPPPTAAAAAAAEVARLTRLVAAERAGRAAAERALRDALNGRLYDPAAPSPGYPVFPVGTVTGPFRQRRGAGRQGLLVPDARATVLLAPSVPPETLEGLAGYSHAYLLWVFHENTIAVPPAAPAAARRERRQQRQDAGAGGASSSAADDGGSGGGAPPPPRASAANPWTTLGRSFAARVAAPGLYGAKTGVFATRSPHRPNALGLSLVRIVAVDPPRRSLTVSGCDLIEGTPVVDIKPAGPFDCPVCVGRVLRGDYYDGGVGGGGSSDCGGGHHHGSSSGGGDHAATTAAAAAAAAAPSAAPPPPPPPAGYTHVPPDTTPDMWALRLPAWVAAGLAGGGRRLPVAFAPGALEALRALALGGALAFYRGGDAAEADAAARAVVQTLSLDIRAVHRGRGAAVRVAAGGGAGGEGEGEGEGGGEGGGGGDDAGDGGAGGDGDSSTAACGIAPPSAATDATGSRYQRYELYYDALYVVFTVRPAAADAEPGAAPLWCCVESVAHSPMPAAAGGKQSQRKPPTTIAEQQA